MQGSYRLYKLCYSIIWPFVSLRYWRKVKGRENIAPGGAILCGNHSSNIDPVLLGYAYTIKTHVHFMAKTELFKIPLLGRIIRAIGTFPVERDKTDVAAVKTAMKYLKNGEKVAMFPEGTRIMDEDNVEAKSGAVIMAVRSNVPIVPIYISRKKRWFKRVSIVIGEPYYVPLDKKTAQVNDYDRETIKLMETINGLKAID